jgi:hypothetical protein
MRGTLLQSKSSQPTVPGARRRAFRHSIFEDEGAERTLRTEELSRDVQGLGSHDDNLLAVEQLLGDSACEPAKEVTLGIDRDLFHVAISRRFQDPPWWEPSRDVRVAERRRGARGGRMGADSRRSQRSTSCPATRRMRRQISQRLPESSTCVMVRDGCRFVVEVRLWVSSGGSRVQQIVMSLREV